MLRCSGGSAPLLFAYGKNKFSHDMAHLSGVQCTFVFYFNFDRNSCMQIVLDLDQTRPLRPLTRVCTAWQDPKNGMLGINWLRTYEPHHEKTCLCHMRTTKAQISLRICTVWGCEFTPRCCLSNFS